MSVLITGAGGFVGRNAVELLLARGERVEVIARRAPAADERVVWHEADLLDPSAVSRAIEASDAERLIHLAWYAVPGRFWSAPENERWISATLWLLRSFAEHGGRRAVVAGSCAEYAWGPPLLDERSTPLEPATLYGACKHATHVAAAALARELELSLAWGRIFFVYGPEEDSRRLVSSVARGLLAGEDVQTTQGLQRRDFMHVADVARALVELALSDVQGAVNISTGEAPQVREIVELIGAAAGARERLRVGALPTREGEPEVLAGDPRRLRDEVGFEPHVGLAEGLQETVEWWRAELARGDGAPSGRSVA